MEFLELAGFDCRGAGTYAEASSILTSSPAPDVLITDIRLGSFNGLQLVLKRPAHVPAIVITGFVDGTLEAEARRHGARFLQKPVDPAELVVVVRELLS